MVNNKIYIGQTNNPTRRWQQHVSSAKHDPTCQVITKAMAKHGIDNFTYDIIASCKTQEDADITETEVIAQEQCLVPIGYNVMIGGFSSPRTPEMVQRIQIGRKKYYETHPYPNTGKILSDEVKSNMSKAAMGKPGTNLGKTFNNEWRAKLSAAISGIPRPSARFFSEEVEKEVCKLYLEEGKSMHYLSRKFDCYKTVIKAALLRANIEVRSSPNNKEPQDKITPEKELQMCRFIIEKELSVAKIAIKFNCSETYVRKILRKNDVELPSKQAKKEI